ncbi:BUB3 [Malassezia furfur]|nr:BUB3 [Malassezia furfur]
MSTPASFDEVLSPFPPRDPVSAFAFFRDASSSRAANLLVASWDKLQDWRQCDQGPSGVRVLQTFEHPAAVLDMCWINESLAASACLDRRVRLLNLETGQAVIIGKHENGVCRIRYDDPTQLLISGSWDASLKLWNPFAEPDQALRHTISLPHKVFAMDTVPIYTGAPTVEAKDPTPRLVVAMAERLVHIYNLRTVRDALDANELEDASKPEQTRESSLKFMLRDVRCMPEGIGYATSSIEGRIAVEFFDPSPEGQAQKYAFKCHRKEVDGEDVVFPIHALAFDPRYGTFATGGGDAHCALWDPVAKKRIRQYVLSAAVSALAFSADGHMLAIATGADNLDEDSAPGEVQVVMKPALEDAK